MNFYVFIALIIVLGDQIIKYLVSTNMFVGQSILVIPNIFHLTYILNAGAAFGILANQRYFFIIIAVLLVAIVIYFRQKLLYQPKAVQMGIYMLLGGALGNMIDRIILGKVIDYMDFRIWPIFNLADVAIVLGCMIIIYKLIFTNGAEK